MNYESIQAAALLAYSQAAGAIWGCVKIYDKDKPIHSAGDALACTACVSASLQALLDWLQVFQIHLLSIH